MKGTTPYRAAVSRAFTIVEVMVVIGIIALLIGLLLPGLSLVRKTANATKSQSNLRQWGMGTLVYAGLHDERLPWEGLKNASDMELNLANDKYWANAIPPLVDKRAYKDVNQEAFANQTNVPFRDSDSIFIDPAADPEMDTPWGYGEPGGSEVQHQFYFNYVPNSQLNNTLMAQINAPAYSPDLAMRLSHIKQPEITVLMLEMRARFSELPASDVFRDKDLKRHRTDWKRFAARHFAGGHLMFADGHVGWMTNLEATTNSQGSRDPNLANGDWNTNKLCWDPMGPAKNED